MKIEKGYEPLAQVLQEALDQAQVGKGARCHANGLPFLEQPIMTGGRECGPGGLAFQARKKILEALNCKDDERAIADLLGAINYTAAMVILRREKATVMAAGTISGSDVAAGWVTNIEDSDLVKRYQNGGLGR